MLFYKTRIQTRLPKETVLDRLNGLMQPSLEVGRYMGEWLGLRSAETAPFIGRLDGSQFQCRRTIYYGNAFRPRIKGRVTEAFGGTHIDLWMHPGIFISLFALFWFSFVIYGVAVFASSAGEVPLGLLAMLVLGAVLVGGCFYGEAVVAHRLLARHLNQAEDDVMSGQNPGGAGLSWGRQRLGLVPVWRILAAVLVFEVIGGIIGLVSQPFGRPMLDFWYGGAVAALPSVVAGIVWQILWCRDSWREYLVMMALLALGGMALTLSAVFLGRLI